MNCFRSIWNRKIFHSVISQFYLVQFRSDCHCVGSLNVQRTNDENFIHSIVVNCIDTKYNHKLHLSTINYILHHNHHTVYPTFHWGTNFNSSHAGSRISTTSTTKIWFIGYRFVMKIMRTSLCSIIYADRHVSSMYDEHDHLIILCKTRSKV